MPHEAEDYKAFARKAMSVNPMMRATQAVVKGTERAKGMYHEGKKRAKKYIDRFRPMDRMSKR